MREWISDDTTREDPPKMRWRKINHRCKRDRALAKVVMALYHETDLCRQEGCRLVAMGVGKATWRVEIKHHKWCLMGMRSH